ncbi:unnamed protein product [Clonostachys rosea f. rosea IK726]|uniref:Uncharacterized protein n=1 Tax=Clonostachys rosea f. rosea IK726 TaxID=1349383 RepID=A0ACA9TL89_BIOOC|nr:unnamed protein product [Clonostachys rosea f. rosea IK726]
MTNQNIRLAIIGFSGLIGKRHTTHVLANPSTELVATVDPSPTAPTVASSLGIEHVPLFTSIAEMLNSNVPRPDAAIVCTPNHTHVPLATELVEAGIPVLVEKPLSNDVESGQGLVNLARSKGVPLLVGHHRRFNPYIIAAKHALESGEVGKVTAISGIWAVFKPDPYFDASPVGAWRKYKSQGGGVVLINMIHEVDNLQFLFGPIIRIHAEETLRRRTTTAGGDDDDAAEEGAALTLRFASGVVGTFIISDAVVSPHNFEMGTGENPTMPRVRLPHGSDEIDVYRIFGTEGTLSVPDMRLWRYHEGTEKSWTSPIGYEKLAIDQDPRVPFDRQLDHFVKVVLGQDEPNCTGQQGLSALEVCEAIRSAIRSDTGTVTLKREVSN